MINIKTALSYGKEKLELAGAQSALLDTQLLLASILNVDKIHLYCNMNEQVDKKNYSRFVELIDERASGCPLQYILNKQEFMGMDFYVGEGVLIPRPDTEILVEDVLEYLKRDIFNDATNISIADIGSGSGAIGISLAKFESRANICSVDISLEALDITKRNIQQLDVKNRVSVFEGNMLDPLIDIDKKFDVLVSNPPYIPSEDIDGLQVEVAKYEPRLALDGGADGLKFYREIVQKAPLILKDKALIAFEIGYDQAEDLKSLFNKDSRYKNIEVIKDLAGLDRVVKAEFVNEYNL